MSDDQPVSGTPDAEGESVSSAPAAGAGELDTSRDAAADTKSSPHHAVPGATEPGAPRTPGRARRMTLARPVVLAVAAVAITIAAARTTVSVTLEPPREQAGVPQRSSVLVDETSLACPGQLRLGASGLRDVPGALSVTTAAPPISALAAVATPSGTGEVLLLQGSGTTPLGTTQTRSGAVTATPTTGELLLASGSGALAPGLAATQTWSRDRDDDRGLAVTPCTPPASDVWLVGGGAGPGRIERLIVSNAGANAVGVAFEVHGTAGLVDTGNRAPLTVPPRSRLVVSLDALAPDEAAPAVHVVATGGVVSAVLDDAWIDGATARGLDDAIAAAMPGRDLVIPGVDANGATVVRLVNPGTREALAQVRVLTATGPVQPAALRAVRVPAGATKDVPLTLPSGAPVGLRVISDQPLTGAAWVERRSQTADRMGDFGWVPAMRPLSGIGGVLLPDLAPTNVRKMLLLASDTGAAEVTVTIGQAQQERQVTMALKADSAAYLDLGAADRVWVTSTGRVSAAVSVEATRDGSPLYSVAAVTSAPVTVVSTPVRQVAG